MKATEPLGSPAVRWWSVLVGVLLLGLAFVAGRELRIYYKPESQLVSWVKPILEQLGTNTYHPAMTPIAVIAVVVGIILIVVGCMPRPRNYLAATGELSTWLRPVDVARSISASAKTLPGVATATTRVRRKGVTLTVEAKEGQDTEMLRARLEERFGAFLKGVLAEPPVLVVTVNAAPQPAAVAPTAPAPAAVAAGAVPADVSTAETVAFQAALAEEEAQRD